METISEATKRALLIEIRRKGSSIKKVSERFGVPVDVLIGLCKPSFEEASAPQTESVGVKIETDDGVIITLEGNLSSDRVAKIIQATVE